jgi:hypothetical protein
MPGISQGKTTTVQMRIYKKLFILTQLPNGIPRPNRPRGASRQSIVTGMPGAQLPEIANVGRNGARNFIIVEIDVRQTDQVVELFGNSSDDTIVADVQILQRGQDAQFGA